MALGLRAARIRAARVHSTVHHSGVCSLADAKDCAKCRSDLRYSGCSDRWCSGGFPGHAAS
eukprot:4992119-Lingulodinium_polyedra.AAC.1